MDAALADQLRGHIDVVNKCAYLPEKQVLDLCTRCTKLFAAEQNMVHVDVPVTIVGDIHGTSRRGYHRSTVSNVSWQANFTT